MWGRGGRLDRSDGDRSNPQCPGRYGHRRVHASRQGERPRPSGGARLGLDDNDDVHGNSGFGWGLILAVGHGTGKNDRQASTKCQGAHVWKAHGYSPIPNRTW